MISFARPGKNFFNVFKDGKFKEHTPVEKQPQYRATAYYADFFKKSQSNKYKLWYNEDSFKLKQAFLLCEMISAGDDDF